MLSVRPLIATRRRRRLLRQPAAPGSGRSSAGRRSRSRSSRSTIERAAVWALRDNNVWGEWDEPLLAELLAELAAEGVDLTLTGFDGRDLDRSARRLQQPQTQTTRLPSPLPNPSPNPARRYRSETTGCSAATHAMPIRSPDCSAMSGRRWR